MGGGRGRSGGAIRVKASIELVQFPALSSYNANKALHQLPYLGRLNVFLSVLVKILQYAL